MISMFPGTGEELQLVQKESDKTPSSEDVHTHRCVETRHSRPHGTYVNPQLKSEPHYE